MVGGWNVKDVVVQRLVIDGNRLQADPYGAEIEFVDRQLARLRRALGELDEGAVTVRAEYSGHLGAARSPP